MNRRVLVKGFVLLVLVACALVATSCTQVAAGGAVVTVTGMPVANGHVVYVSLFDTSNNLLAINVGQTNAATVGEMTSGTTGTLHLYQLSNQSVEYVTKSDTTYHLEVWIDMNDNYATKTQPDKGIDYICQPWPMVLTPDANGDITEGLTASDFILAQ